MKSLLMTLSVIIMSHSAMAFSANEQVMKSEMKRTAKSVAQIYSAMYAPKAWKKEFAQWDLDAEEQKVLAGIDALEGADVKGFHKLMASFFHATEDYHVGFSLVTDESATLPFEVRGAGGKYFLTHVDRNLLDSTSFPFNPGDELVSFDGRPVAEVVAEVKKTVGHNVELTDNRLAEMTLTRRRASRGHSVPRGPVTLGLKKKGGDKVVEHQLVWDYKAPTIDLSNVGINNKFNEHNEKNLGERIAATSMHSSYAIELAGDRDLNPLSIGVKKSFIPRLGTVIWESDDKELFDAYMFFTEDKKVVGYIRVPSYSAGEKESKEFEKHLKKFSELTDALVIDQVNNPGGSVFYLYSLVSMLTDTAVSTPKHRMQITAKDVVEALTELPKLEKIKTQEELEKHFNGKTVSGYPVSMTFLGFVKAYFQFIIDEFNAGRNLTDPYHIWGVDKINPHPAVNYTKPVLLLVNELDFSGGDFFPAILQDNERVTILGTRTAGAGGYVLSAEVPNVFGLGGFSVTGSLAERVDSNPIENLGVTADVQYQLTVEDFQNDFKPYKKKILETLSTLLQ